MAKPRVNMDRLGISKAEAAAAIPFAKPPSPEPAPAGVGRSLTVKLTAEDYWALRDYCAQQERATGKRLTHQQVMVDGLRALLGRRAAA